MRVRLYPRIPYPPRLSSCWRMIYPPRKCYLDTLRRTTKSNSPQRKISQLLVGSPTTSCSQLDSRDWSPPTLWLQPRLSWLFEPLYAFRSRPTPSYSPLSNNTGTRFRRTTPTRRNTKDTAESAPTSRLASHEWVTLTCNSPQRKLHPKYKSSPDRLCVRLSSPKTSRFALSRTSTLSTPCTPPSLQPCSLKPPSISRWHLPEKSSSTPASLTNLGNRKWPLFDDKTWLVFARAIAGSRCCTGRYLQTATTTGLSSTLKRVRRLLPRWGLWPRIPRSGRSGWSCLRSLDAPWCLLFLIFGLEKKTFPAFGCPLDKNRNGMYDATTNTCKPRLEKKEQKTDDDVVSFVAVSLWNEK